MSEKRSVPKGLKEAQALHRSISFAVGKFNERKNALRGELYNIEQTLIALERERDIAEQQLRGFRPQKRGRPRKASK
jgi:hypothetical protein